jgi:hypothetical protein
MLDTVTMSHAVDAHAGGADGDAFVAGADDSPDAHAVDAHDAGHSARHDHDEPGESLGPIDLMAWAYAVAGGAIGVVTAAALLAASAG